MSLTPLPQALLAYWNANQLGLPVIYYEYAPEEQPLPVAVFDPAGFYFEPGNLGFRMDTYRYRFSIFTTDAPTTYGAGFSAVSYMLRFDYPGLIKLMPKPADMATPLTVGQDTIWKYEFTVDFQLQPAS